MQHARGAIPGEPDVPFHVGIGRKQLAAPVEREAVGIAESTGEDLDDAAGRVGAKDPPARRLDAEAIAVRVFVARREQVAFVVMMVWAVRVFRLFGLRVIADEHVDHAVGTKLRHVRAVLAHLAREFDEKIDVLGRGRLGIRRVIFVGACFIGLCFVGSGLVVGGFAFVAGRRLVIIVRDAIESRPVRPGADHEHLPVERQDALDVLDLVAIDRSFIRQAAVRRALEQQQWAGLTGRENFAEFVERHRQQRAGFLRVGDRLDAEFLGDAEAAGDISPGHLHFIEPRFHDAELPDRARRQPLRVVEADERPLREFLLARFPVGIGEIADVSVARAFYEHSGGDPGRTRAARGRLDADRVAARDKIFSDVMRVHHPPVLPLGGLVAIDIEFIRLIGRDLHLAGLGLGHVEAAAEEACAARRVFHLLDGRPNPLCLLSRRRGGAKRAAVAKPAEAEEDAGQASGRSRETADPSHGSLPARVRNVEAA